MFARKQYVDYIKGIGIILVVLGHINYANGFIKSWIYAFHMPLFFVAAGLTTRQLTFVSVKQEGKFLLKKVKSLIIPYLLWGVIYAGYSPRNVINLLYGSYSRISAAGSLSSLWFLPTMFLAVCGMETIKILDCKLKFKKTGYVLIMVLCAVVSLWMSEARSEYPLCLNVAIMALAYIVFGVLLESAMDDIQKADKQNRTMWYILMAIGFFGTLTYKFNPIIQTGNVMMANMRVGAPWAFIVTSLMGCVMVYGLARILDYGCGNIKWLLFLGRNSMVVFVVHKPLIEFFGGTGIMAKTPDWIELSISAVFVLTVASGLCVVINYFAPCLAGKSGANT